MKAVSQNPKGIAVLLVAVLGGASAIPAQAESPVVRWERIEGIDPNPTGQVLSGISPVSFPWSTTRGNATFNIENGNLQFHVEGLSMGASPTPVARIGTTGAVTQVKGTILCHQSGEFVDSEPVDLSDDGDAMFSGQLPSVPYCEANELIFLLRIAAVVPGAPPIDGLWLAHGAARKIR